MARYGGGRRPDEKRDDLKEKNRNTDQRREGRSSVEKMPLAVVSAGTEDMDSYFRWRDSICRVIASSLTSPQSWSASIS